MREKNGWRKSCMAELPAGGVASAIEGGVLTAKLLHPCLKKQTRNHPPPPQIMHCPWQCCFYVRDFTNVVISVKKYQQNYSERENFGLKACLDWGNLYCIGSTGASCWGDLGASKSGWLHCDINCNNFNRFPGSVLCYTSIACVH